MLFSNFSSNIVENVKTQDGWECKIITKSGTTNFGYTWHYNPDGGATFKTDDGWIYVSNSESELKQGGVGALKFNNSGTLVDSYSILENTTRNCSGGKTPWGTWLSCEETPHGYVWECDPLGEKDPIRRDQLGRFSHEAAAVDPSNNYIYLTEDGGYNRLLRWEPKEKNNVFGEGALRAASRSANGKVKWVHHNSSAATDFKGPEGICFYEDREAIYFTTKIDNKVWSLSVKDDILVPIYEENHPLYGVDNITIDNEGNLYIAEDGGNMQIIKLSLHNNIWRPEVFLQIYNQPISEIAGLAFTPDFKKMYFSSQRGFYGKGITYEVSKI